VGFREKWTGQKTKSKEIKPIDEEETYFKQMQTSFLNSLAVAVDKSWWGGTRTCPKTSAWATQLQQQHTSTFNNNSNKLKHHDVYPNGTTRTMNPYHIKP
jgi:hypothetical protein